MQTPPVGAPVVDLMTGDRDRALLEAVAAALVEPAAGLPGAATVGIADRIDSVLASYPHYGEPLSEALDLLSAPIPLARVAPTAGDSDADPNPAPITSAIATRLDGTDWGAPDDLIASLAALERSRPDLFTPLLEVVVGAWALSEPVWEALGYEGQRDLDPAAHPIPEEIFEPLLARGPRWRQPPEVDR